MATGQRVNGPAAALRATAEAMAKAGGAGAVILVEGISDQIALETAARCRGRDLDAEHVVVVPIGGAHAIGRFLPGFAHLLVAGLYDVGEEAVIRRRLGGLEGFFACDRDLEDELIRAVGTAGVEALFEANGDLGAFRSMQNQPAWRGHETGAQMRRFLASGSRRRRRYVRILVERAVPPPLDAVLAYVARTSSNASATGPGASSA